MEMRQSVEPGDVCQDEHRDDDDALVICGKPVSVELIGSGLYLCPYHAQMYFDNY
jgi:hypothetical protein